MEAVGSKCGNKYYMAQKGEKISFDKVIYMPTILLNYLKN
jgi:hypothetical protein